MKHEVVVDFVVDLYTLYNFYLDAEGLYQIRASMQADSRYYSQVLLGPARRLNATYVSKSFFVTRTCDSIQNDLHETVRFEVHLFLKDDVRVRLADAQYELRLEIWCSKNDKDDPPARNHLPAPFVAVTARVLTLNFDPARGLHDYYPLVFEVGNVSVLTMTIHASLVTICIPSGESMRNASMGHLVGQLCMCDGQSSCCYSTTIDKAAQQELNSLLTATACHLRKILEEHKRPTPTRAKSKTKDTDIGNDPGSERARLRVSRYSTFDRPEAVRFPDEEAKKFSTILVVLWEQYIEAVAGHQDLRFVLYEPLQRARIARLAEAYLVLDKDLGAVYYDAVLGEDMYRRMVRKIRGSNYFKSFPVLEIECWPLDGNHKNTPIIFEERYRPFSAVTPINDEERDNSAQLDELAELASLHSLTAGSMELLALSSHPESEVCNCWRQFRATNFRLRRPSAASLPPALVDLYQGSSTTCCYRINDTERFVHMKRSLWESMKIPVPWHTPDVSELVLLNFPSPKAPKPESLHLIVMVHGMYGCSTDMRLLRVFLELAQPRSNIRFLMSRANEREETFKDFDTLGVRLATEIVEHLKKYSKKPARISFIGFSMGNVIIRSALAKAELRPLHRFLHTFLSLCGPHVGTVFNTSFVVNMGMWYLQRFENTASLKQMMLVDSQDVRKTYLYRLSQDKAMTNFKNILLLGSADDYIVPLHSAHIKLAKHIVRDTTPMGAAYREMLRNILKPLIDKPDLNLVRLEVHVPFRSSLISSNVHIAPLDCEILVQKIALVACARHLL